MKIRNYLLITVLTLALMIMACGCNLSLPVTQIKTGSAQYVDLQVPLPEGSPSSVELNLEFVAGDLKLSPGANGFLVSGSATFNADDFKPIIESTGTSYTLRTGDLELKGIPKFGDDLKNAWDLQIANLPMSLNIKAGPYNGSFELGGLSLEKLVIDEAGSDVTCAFSQPNQIEMSSFTYSTGGSKNVLKGLANANFEQMTFTSGAGDYTLSFDGKLQHDTQVTIDTGASTVNIIMPQGTNALVTFDGGLTSVNKDNGWAQNDNTYTLSGSGPTITITIKMGLGTLNLKTE